MTPGMLIAILVLVGLGFMGIGVWMLLKERKKRAVCSAQVTAELLRYEKEKRTSIDNGTTIYYFPVFRYMANGQEQTVRYSTGSNRRKWKPGAQVSIRYNPDEPGIIKIPGDIGSYFGFAIAEILGLVCLVSGVLAALGVVEINL